MNRTFPWLAVLSFALLLSACTPVRWFRADTRGKRDFSMDPRRTFQEVDFRDMLAAPQSYKGMDVKFTAMMNRRDENVWEPYYSSMSETEFSSFSIWTTDAEIWTENGWLSSLPTVYVRKDNPNLNDFFEVRRFEIAVIRATVRTDFQDLPWLEVHYIDPIENPRYAPAAVSALVRGLREVKENRNGAAIGSLESALDGTLSGRARFTAHMNLGALYMDRAGVSGSVGDYKAAVGNYGRAVGLNRGDREAAAALKSAEEKLYQRRLTLGLLGDEEAEVPRVSLDAQIQRMREELKAAKEAVDKAGALYSADANLLQKAEEAEERLGELRLRHEEIEAALKNRTEEVAVLKEENEKIAVSAGPVAEENKKLRADLDAAVRDRDEYMKRVEDLKTLDQSAAELDSERDRLKAEAEEARMKTEKLQTRITRLQDAAATLTKEKEELQEELSSQGGDKARIQELREEISGKDQAIGTLKNDVTALTEERNELKALVDASDQDTTDRLNEAQNKINERDATIRDLQKQIGEKSGEITAMEESRAALVKERDQLKEHLAEDGTDVNQIESLHKSITEKDEAIRGKGEIIDAQRKQNQALQEELKKLQEKLEEK